MNFRCYSQRLLNPFRGAMNVIEFEAAEAVTLDGIHWDIYVRDAELVKDLPNSHKVQTSDIRYGKWSKQSGLKRGAIYPSEDFKNLEAQGAIVYEHLLKHHQDIPFPLIDFYEFWLLDQSENPLVLLNSCIHEEYIELDHIPEWCACFESHHSFFSDAAKPEREHNQQNLSAGEYLSQYVNQLAGKDMRAQWFKRNKDGSGNACGGLNLHESLASRQLEAHAFSPYLINETSHDEIHGRLIRDFIDWQAPCLLLLQNLTKEQRRYFEIKAKQRALEVEKQHRFYPDIIDQSQINAARVEAKFRISSDRPKNPSEDIMSPEYIELMHPCPGE